jgi:DNA polymerase-3 subunit epsilon
MYSKRYVICDVEATGLDTERDLIEIALITWQDGRITDIYQSLINPLRPIPEFISNLTSITNRTLREAPKFYDIADAIKIRLEGAIFVSHNTDFDLGLLQKKFHELGEELKVQKFCTLKAAHEIIPGLLNYNLDALCNFFGIKITERHRAFGDAWATLELFKELLNLRPQNSSKILFLPHHEKILKKISSKSGLLYFKDNLSKVIRIEASSDMAESARLLLRLKPENRDLLLKTVSIHEEATGSVLIAEFKKLLLRPFKPRYVISIKEFKTGEKFFKLQSFKKNIEGLWYFESFFEAKIKLRNLEEKLKSDRFVYREGRISKEEILKKNQMVSMLSKSALFPSEHLIILGKGRTPHEKSIVLISHNHVLGFGYTEDTDENIYNQPQMYLTTRFSCNIGVDLSARRHLKVLKNLKQKNEIWRSLTKISMTPNSRCEFIS